jgi:O-antigen/teichoic acid export membrane protein
MKKKGFFHLLLANFLVNFFAFGSQLLVAWILTPTELGQIKILQTFVTVAVIFASFGFDASTLKLCSENIDIERKRKLFRSAHFYTLLAVIFTYSIVCILSQFRIISADQFINNYFYIFLITLIPQTFSMLHFAYLQALKKIELLAKIQTTAKVISFTFVIVITYFYGINGFIFAYILGYVVTSLILFANNKKELIFDNPTNKNDFISHWKHAKFAFLSNLTSGLSRYLDVFIINFFIIDREAIGMYSFALNIVLILQIVGDTIQRISIPHFSEKSDNIIHWKIVFKKYYKIFILFAISFLILLNLFIEPAIQIAFNGKYNSSIIFVRILSLRWFFYALVQFKGSALFGLGKINYNFYGSVIFLIINFVLQYILVIKFGILGVVWGVAFGSVIYYFIYNYIFKFAKKH